MCGRLCAAWLQRVAGTWSEQKALLRRPLFDVQYGWAELVGTDYASAREELVPARIFGDVVMSLPARVGEGAGATFGLGSAPRCKCIMVLTSMKDRTRKGSSAVMCRSLRFRVWKSKFRFEGLEHFKFGFRVAGSALGVHMVECSGRSRPKP